MTVSGFLKITENLETTALFQYQQNYVNYVIVLSVYIKKYYVSFFILLQGSIAMQFQNCMTQNLPIMYYIYFTFQSRLIK